MRDDGSLSVELAVLAPAFILLFVLVVFVGRLQSARTDIEAATHGAARSITLSRHPAEAAEVAEASARERLGAGGRPCRAMGWDAAITDAEATVTISCEVDLADLALVPLRRNVHVQATSTEVFDIYAEDPQP